MKYSCLREKDSEKKIAVVSEVSAGYLCVNSLNSQNFGGYGSLTRLKKRKLQQS